MCMQTSRDTVPAVVVGETGTEVEVLLMKKNNSLRNGH